MKILYKILIPLSLLMFIALAALSLIGYSNIAREIDNVMRVTTQATLEDIAFEQRTIDNVTETLKESLNGNFLRIARSLSILIGDSAFDLTYDEYREIADEVGIDEIHIVNGEGVLVTGNVPDFFGFDFSSGDQTRPFLKILDSPSLELAETSSESSGSISRLIAEIIEGIQRTSENMSGTLKTFDSINQEVDSTVNAFMEIESSVSELTVGGQQIMESTEQINNVTVQVNAGSSEIHKGIESSNQALLVIKDSSSQITGEMNEVNGKTSEVSQAMEELQKVSGDLNKIASDLTEKFSRFKTKEEV